MSIPGLFKQYKPKGFNLAPRYYDPDRERREERLKRIKSELGIKEDGEGDDYVPRIQRGSMSNYFQQKTRRVQRYTLIRLVVILLILFLISYIFFYL